MLWQQKTDDSNFIVPDDILDLSFGIDCAQLPVDHAWHLYQALDQALPWLQEEPSAAIHSIFGAASGNGWVRPPEVPGELIQLSKRTRLTLRLPKHRVAEASRLTGQTLDIGGFPLTVGNGKTKLLAASRTIFSRSVASEQIDNEEDFSQSIGDELAQMNIQVRKLLCGLAHSISGAGESVSARSVMLADLELDESIRLQQSGLGTDLKFGCGIFLPHKNIAAVGSSTDEI